MPDIDFADMRTPIPDLVEDLREIARRDTDIANDRIPQTAIKLGLASGFAVEEHTCWEAADRIEEMHGALVRIHEGEDPKTVAAPFVDD